MINTVELEVIEKLAA